MWMWDPAIACHVCRADLVGAPVLSTPRVVVYPAGVEHNPDQTAGKCMWDHADLVGTPGICSEGVLHISPPKQPHNERMNLKEQRKGER